jgi:hypothetical protein
LEKQVKVSQLLEHEDSIVASQFAKLRSAGHEVKIDALGAPFRTGNHSQGWKIIRPKHEAWILSKTIGFFRPDQATVTGTAVPPSQRTGGLHHSAHINLKRPLDDYYTIKKIDGQWTIVDRQDEAPEENSQDHKHYSNEGYAKIESPISIQKQSSEAPLKEKKNSEEAKSVKPGYVKGLNDEEKQLMKREIARFSKMPHTDKDAYPEDWIADKKYKERLKKQNKTIPKSEHTKEFERRFGK